MDNSSQAAYSLDTPLFNRTWDGSTNPEELLEEEIIQAAALAGDELSRLTSESSDLSQPIILVVDDDHIVARAISQQMMKFGYKTFFVGGGAEVWEFMREVVPHVLITDVRMPGINGLELLAQVTAQHPDMVVAVTSGAPDVQMAIEALRAGAVDFVVKPIDFNALHDAIERGLSRRRARVRQRRYQVNLEHMILERSRRLIASTQALAQRTREIGLAYRDLVIRLGRASQWRDDETGEHIQRIGLFCAEIAQSMGLNRGEVEMIGEAAPMHDIGKIGVPDSILLKPGRLTPLEFECMKTHTQIGAELFSGSEVPLLRASEAIAISHHEWYNGGGYPYGIAKDQIPLFGKIVAVADVYDALTHERSYKRAVPIDETIATMRARRGLQFDPGVFDAFLRVVDNFPGIERRLAETPKPVSKYNVETGLFKMSRMFPVGASGG
ncbi:response regulator [bacterium]|nr:response regulator [bacterium]